MSSGDSTGASISELERKRLRKAELRATRKYKAIAKDENNKFTPKVVMAWVRDREGGKMMKLTQHTDVRDIMIYGKKVSQRGSRRIQQALPIMSLLMWHELRGSLLDGKGSPQIKFKSRH